MQVPRDSGTWGGGVCSIGVGQVGALRGARECEEREGRRALGRKVTFDGCDVSALHRHGDPALHIIYTRV